MINDLVNVMLLFYFCVGVAVFYIFHFDKLKIGWVEFRVNVTALNLQEVLISFRYMLLKIGKKRKKLFSRIFPASNLDNLFDELG